MCLRLFIACIGILCASITFGQEKPNQPRIVTGLKSSDQLLSDLEYMVSDLAQKPQTWKVKLFPNLDIFLLGVDATKTVRYDLLFKSDVGMQNQLMIPVTDTDEFLQDNLDPIGIESRRDRRDKDLYELTGNVFEGWLRHLKEAGYAVISKDKADVPKVMPNPVDAHNHLTKAGYLVFAEFNNDAAGLSDRQKSFEKFKANIVDGIQKTPTESKESFELRKATSSMTMDLLAQYFSEAKQMRYGLKVDQAKHTGVGELLFAALPDTDLAKGFDQVGKTPSYFKALKAAEGAALDLHINFPVNEKRQKEYANIYELSRPVIVEKIDQDAKATPAEKEARKKISGLIQDILIDSTQLGLVDLFAEISKQGTHHTALIATRCNSTDKIAEIVTLLPAAQEGWSVEIDVEKIHDVAIHKLSLGKKVPKSLSDFYGNSGDICIAAGKDTFWLSGGDNALDVIKTAINSVHGGEAEATAAGEETAKPQPTDGVLVDLKMKAGPLLQSMDDFNKEEDLGVLKLFQPGAFLKKEKEKETSPKKEDDSKPGMKATGALANFEWKSAAITALKDENDSVSFILKKVEDGTITGYSNGEKGILKAFGALLAKFADENLQ